MKFDGLRNVLLALGWGSPAVALTYQINGFIIVIQRNIKAKKVLNYVADAL